ncbi:AraC family transcriptional regulator [Rhodococcus sp. 06-156-3C]|uniref:helix-turn-helix domain-containing protein n=1 Tax=Nocardiaceae TaxID=85025 RepID=UPI000522FAB5|nr:MULTISPECIES: helix-turn-helix domain-containing protein [Rhodococcus]OZD11567.1 AraC family transcriptional regulator [Rhodococcus sp. 06-156-3C]OZD13800.1 AraC family transcriptional regulator [Rhodococcus sp. 06-156-4a]OZD22232.1 AraC family transcriptional regulator [Rhodococcus sp. 06-156-4C]OZD30429.1 AraC family transcriptional regulator [Rhodococcus sp. 06-156-3]OZD37717.1 AraC family transcriptional regulator [Rhodococcus sp. 06-156-3b]
MLVRSGFSVPSRTTRACDWSDMLREHFVALDVDGIERDCPFTGSVKSNDLSYLKVSTVQSTEQRIARTDSLINSDRADYLQIGLLRRGGAVVSQDGRTCTLHRGDYVLYDTTRPFDWQIEGHADDPSWALDVFTWPKTTLALSEVEIRAMTAVTLDGRAGLSGLLGRFLRDLASVRTTDSDVRGEEQVVEEIGGLVKSVLNATVRPAVSRSTPLYDRALSFIDDNLGDPALAPTDVASSVGVSVRQLHRVFAEHHSTVSRSIRSRRLAQCRQEMCSHDDSDRSLSQISHRWGFVDLSVFSRAFKDEFGTSPSRYRARAHESGEHRTV